jgi:hypothetical protein
MGEALANNASQRTLLISQPSAERLEYGCRIHIRAGLTGTQREHRTDPEHQPGTTIMARLTRDMLSLASCGGFVWMVWQAALLVSAS